MTPGQALVGVLQYLSEGLSAVYPREEPAEGDTSWLQAFDVDEIGNFIVSDVLDLFVSSESLFWIKMTPGDIRVRLRTLLENIRDGQIAVNTPEDIVPEVEAIVRDLALFARAITVD